MEKFQVTVLGCGSALPTLRHKASAQVVNIRDKYFLLDCAEGTQLELRRNHIHLNRINTIFITHLHGDHCFGLVGMLSTLSLLGRTADMHIYGPIGIEQTFRPQLDFFCEGIAYRIHFHEINTKEFSEVFEDRSLSVFSIPLKHRVPCCGYLFKEKPLRPHIRPEAIKKYEIPVWQINNIKAGCDFQLPDGTIICNEQLTTPADPPRSFAYCTDTMYSPRIADLIADADLLYHEATFAESELALCTKVFHSTARQAAQIAEKAHAQQLLIGHFSSRYEDENLLLNEAKAVFPNTVLANEGLTINIMPHNRIAQK